ncbi:unnamed protein product [Sphagnum balticum]
MPSLRSAHHRLTPPIDDTQNRPAWSPGMGPPPPPSKIPPGPTTTILLPASEWNFTFPLIIQSFFPPLPELVDALIDKLLDTPLTDTIWNQLAVLIAYLNVNGYVPIHYVMNGKIRNRLREGKFQLCDCSASQEDESLFTAKVQARIMASMASPVLAGRVPRPIRKERRNTRGKPMPRDARLETPIDTRQDFARVARVPEGGESVSSGDSEEYGESEDSEDSEEIEGEEGFKDEVKG